MRRVGFIGLGAMGRPMARNVLKRGFPLYLLKGRANAAVEELREKGAHPVDTLKVLTEGVEILILMLPSSVEVEQNIFWHNGILEGAHGKLIVIDMGTSDPSSTRRVAAALAEKEAKFLDAPVTRGVKGAETGTLTVMVGGDAQVLESFRPVLEAMAAEIFHVGPVGMGHVFKLINQLICIGNLCVMAEAFAFAEAQEADLRLLFQVLRTGSANSNMLQSQVPDFLAGEYKPRFIMKLAKKDLDLVTGFANQLGVPLPLSSYMKEVFQIGMRWKLGERNESAIFEVWRQFMGHS